MTGRDDLPTTAIGAVDNMNMVCHLDVVIAAGRSLRNLVTPSVKSAKVLPKKLSGSKTF